MYSDYLGVLVSGDISAIVDHQSKGSFVILSLIQGFNLNATIQLCVEES